MDTTLRQFLTLPFWTGTQEALVDELVTRQRNGRSVFVVTLTAEMALCARENAVVADAIRHADIVVADTMSVMCWLLMNRRLVPRITGVDLSDALMRALGPAAVIGGRSMAVVQNAASYVRSKGAIVVYVDQGPVIQDLNTVKAESEAIVAANPAVIFVGFGHGKQEVWIAEARKSARDLPAIWIGVGGTIDLWGGVIRRAPSVMRSLGLEWLWRLFQEPSRIGRIFNATVKFPLRVLYEFLV